MSKRQGQGKLKSPNEKELEKETKRIKEINIDNIYSPE
jgi:hypothetical protein